MPNCTCNPSTHWTDPDCPVCNKREKFEETHHHHKSYRPRDGQRISDLLTQLSSLEPEEPPADDS